MVDEQPENLIPSTGADDEQAESASPSEHFPINHLSGKPFEGEPDTYSPPMTEEVRVDEVVVRTFFPRPSGEGIPSLQPSAEGTSIGARAEVEVSDMPEKAAGITDTSPVEQAEAAELDKTQRRPPRRREKEDATRVHRPPEGKAKRKRRLSFPTVLLLLMAVIGLLAVGGYFVLNSTQVDAVPFIDEAIAFLTSIVPLEQTRLSLEDEGTITPTPTGPGGILLEPSQRPPLTEAPAVGVTMMPPSVSPGTPEATPGEQILTQSGVPMVYVPGGTFTMGDQTGSTPNLAHDVTLSPYYIDKYEVTNAQWAACVADEACPPPASTNAYDGSPYYGVESFDDYPVIFVNWHNADAYCRWRGARLPTEAEWEMAARWDPETGTETTYPWGDEWDPTRLNYCDASCLIGSASDPAHNDGWPQLAPVGSFPDGASAVGALDMVGNVAEWVADWFSATYYSVSEDENPTGPAAGTLRAVRGGAWGVRDATLLTGTARSRFGPGSEAAGLGFRCALSDSAANP